MTVDLFPVRSGAQRASTSHLDAARPGHRARDRSPAAWQRRAPSPGSDAGPVVARRASRAEAGALGLFSPGGGPDAADAASGTCTATSREPNAPIAPSALDWLILRPMSLPKYRTGGSYGRCRCRLPRWRRPTASAASCATKQGDHSRRHRAGGNGRHGQQRRAGDPDDGHRRSRPLCLRRRSARESGA